MTSHIIYQVDSFTTTRFKGNPAGVVLNAQGLAEDQMQAIARELNNSETAFLFPPDDRTCDGVIRYFTPAAEVPTCGHATIAAMYALALEEDLSSCTLKMKTRIGVLPFEIQRSEGRVNVWMTQGEIEIQPPLEPGIRSGILDALGVKPGETDPRCPVQIASTGHSKVMIGISSRECLDSLTPDMRRLSQLSREIGCNGYFVFVLDFDDPMALSHGRMFAPAIGIDEDPVTGNANGPLGAYLVHHGLAAVKNNRFSFSGIQGRAMGREGMIRVEVAVADGRPCRVRIGGEAVKVFRAVMDL